jgi:L-arabinose isomerase
LVIGNDNVPGTKKLKNVEDNMKTMKETLEKMNIPVTLLYNKTKDEIKTELKRIEIMANKADKTGEPF